MLIGLKLNPVHLSLATSVPSALLRFGTTVNKNRNNPPVEPLLFPLFRLRLSLRQHLYRRIGFVERLDRISCGKGSQQFVEMYVDKLYVFDVYASPDGRAF